MVSPLEIFCCYARKDQSLLNELKIHLTPLQRLGLITIWSDIDINAGAIWEEEIKKHLNTAQIILLLISPDFMASDYCYSTEMQRALERHEQKEARVIPILLRPAILKDAPFDRLQVLPTSAKPVTDRRSWLSDDEALNNVAEGIQHTIEELRRTCDILCYDPTIGESEFYSISASGKISSLKKHRWQKIWTHIIPGNFTGGSYTDLLLYSSSTGDVKFLSTDSKGNIKELPQKSEQKIWTHIIPGNFAEGSYTDLLFYSSSTGEVKVVSTDGKGITREIKHLTNWRNNWTYIIPGKFTEGKYTSILCYDSLLGEGKFFSIDSDGDLKEISQKSWQKIWTHIIPCNFTGGSYTDLLFYSSSTGIAKFLSTDGKGNLKEIRKKSWQKIWTRIIAADLIDNKYPVLFFYSASTGEVKLVSTDGKGIIREIKHLPAWRTNYSHIISLKSVKRKVLP